MELPEEDDVDSFNNLVQWLYTQRCELPDDAGPHPSTALSAIKMFVLAEKYGIADLKSLITRNLFNF